MFWVLFLLPLSSCQDYESVLIISSQNTDPYLEYYFYQFPYKTKIELLEFSSIISISLIIDITQSIQYFPQIERLCEFFDAVFITASTQTHSSYSKYRFYGIPSPATGGKNMEKFIQYLNWTSFSLISFSTPQDIEYSTSIKEIISIPCTSIILQTQIDSDYLDSIVKRVIKSSGQKNFVIIGSGLLLYAFQQNIILRKANKPNFYFLFPSFAASQVIISDSLSLSLHSTASSTSSSESIFLYLKFLIDKFLSLPRSEFLKLCPEHEGVRVLGC